MTLSRRCALLLGLAVLGFGSRVAAQEPYAWLPNCGQWPPEVRGAARHGAQTTWLTDTGWTTQVVASTGAPNPRGSEGPEALPRTTHAAVVSVELVGARGVDDVFGERLPGITAFYLGDDPERWASSVPRHVSARRDGVWPGVDLVFSTRAGALAYDLHCAAGTAVEDLKFRVRGAEGLRVAAEGSLEIDVGFGTLRHGAPVAWQEADGDLRSVPVRFVLHADGTFSFSADGRDPARALVIDPPLLWSTLLGGQTNEEVGVRQGTSRREDGAIALAGGTTSWNFPGGPVNGGVDGFVAAYDAAGAFLWSVVVGGGGANNNEGFYACSWETGGGVFFAGMSCSPSFPTTPGCYQGTNLGPFGNYSGGDVVVGRVLPTPAGITLPWSTFFGDVDRDRANGLVALPGGRVAITGWSNSAALTFPAGYQSSLFGGFDGLLLIFDPGASGTGQLISGTWFGGSLGEVPGCVVRDSGGRLIVGAYTASPDIATTANALQSSYQGGPFDGYVAVFDAALTSCLYATYLGGPGSDQANDIAVDAQDRLAIGNWTAGFSFPMPVTAFQPTPSGGANDGYALVLDTSQPPAQQLVWGSYLGGSLQDGVNGIAIDRAGRVTVTGPTEGPALGTSDFPTTSWALQSFRGGPGGTVGHWDAFVARFDPRRQGQDQLVYSTCIGGNGYDYGYDLLLDERARPIVAGVTSSPSFHGSTGLGAQDVFLMQLDLLASVANRLGTPTPICARAYADAYHRSLPNGFDLTLTCSEAPPVAPGLLVLGLPDPAGSVLDPSGLTAWLSLGGPLVTMLTPVSDLLGRADVRLIVPGALPPTGLAVQWLWAGGCSALVGSDAIQL